jgi:hypothetical protein
MKNKKLYLGMMVMALVFGMTVAGCDFFDLLFGDDDDGAGTINGVWYLVDSKNVKNGTIITINDGEGALTAIGSDDCFDVWSTRGKINTGDTVLRNISFLSDASDDDRKRWSCESLLQVSYTSITYITDPGWNKRRIIYNVKDDYMFVYGDGNDTSDGFLGYRFKKQ